eukprot:3562474-Prymnesium_polylepis.1
MSTGHMSSAIFHGNVPQSRALRQLYTPIGSAVVRSCVAADVSCPLIFSACVGSTAADFSPNSTVRPAQVCDSAAVSWQLDTQFSPPFRLVVTPQAGTGSSTSKKNNSEESLATHSPKSIMAPTQTLMM